MIEDILMPIIQDSESAWNAIINLSTLIGAVGFLNLFFPVLSKRSSCSLADANFSYFLLDDNLRRKIQRLLSCASDNPFDFKQIFIAGFVVGYFWYFLFATTSPIPYIFHVSILTQPLLYLNLIFVVASISFSVLRIMKLEKRKRGVVVLAAGILFGIASSILFIVIASAYSGSEGISIYPWLCVGIIVVELLLVPYAVVAIVRNIRKKDLRESLNKSELDKYSSIDIGLLVQTLSIIEPIKKRKVNFLSFLSLSLIGVAISFVLVSLCSPIFNAPGIYKVISDASGDRTVERAYNVVGELKEEIYRSSSGEYQFKYVHTITRDKGIVSFEQYDENGIITGIGSVDWENATELIQGAEDYLNSNGKSICAYQLDSDGSGRVLSSVEADNSDGKGTVWNYRTYEGVYVKRLTPMYSDGTPCSNFQIYSRGASGLIEKIEYRDAEDDHLVWTATYVRRNDDTISEIQWTDVSGTLVQIDYYDENNSFIRSEDV